MAGTVTVNSQRGACEVGFIRMMDPSELEAVSSDSSRPWAEDVVDGFKPESVYESGTEREERVLDSEVLSRERRDCLLESLPWFT